MSSKHTPGPWEQCDAFGPTAHGTCAKATTDNYLIASCTGYYGREQAQANARLIASAPESHEANQLFVQAINEMQGITPDHSDERIYDEMPSSQLAIAYFAARAAIAKATGGAQ